MHFTGKKTNIALLVLGYKKLSPHSAEYEGVVKAPFNLAGQKIKVILNHHAAWSIRSARTAGEALSILSGKGFSSLMDLAEEVEHFFESMSVFGTLAVFQACLQSESDPSTWSAWVGDPVGFVPPNDAIYGYARLVAKKTDKGENKVVADFLYPNQSMKIKSLEDLKSFYAQHLSPVKNGLENNGNCLFRIRSVGSEKVVSFWVYVARKEVPYTDAKGVERRFSIPDELQHTWDASVVSGVQAGGLCRVVASALGESAAVPEKESHIELAKGIRAGLDSGEIVIEAIAGQRHRLIGMVLRYVDDQASHLSRAIRACDLPDGKGVGFYPMIGITNESLPSSANFVKEQVATVVINRVFHDVDEEAVRADAVPFVEAS